LTLNMIKIFDFISKNQLSTQSAKSGNLSENAANAGTQKTQCC